MSYSLAKVTCGGAVRGADLLDNWIIGQPIETILAFRPDQIASTNRESPVREYLRVKHLLAVQAALAEYIGQSSSEKDRPLTLTRVDHCEHGVELSGVLNISVMTEQINACGSCGSGCGGQA